MLSRDNKTLDVSLRIVLVTALLHLLLGGAALAAARNALVEKNVWAHIVSEDFETFQMKSACGI